MRLPAIATICSALLATAARAEEKDFRFFSFGPGALINQDAQGVATHLAGGYFHEASSSAGIRVLGSGDFTSDALNVSAALGALAFLGGGEFAPFAGADLGWGVAYGDGWCNGFVLGGSVGVQMFRSSKVQMNLEGRSSVMFADNDEGFPVVLAGALGVSF